MDDFKNFSDIKCIYSNIINSLDSTEKISEKLNIFKCGIEKYSNFIENFFSGKENNIKNIYSAIRENRYPHNKIIVKDVESISERYFSYFKGLKEFLDIISDLKDTDNQDINKIYSTIKNVIVKDSDFLCSMFNEPGTLKSLDFAMKNIEQLIIFNDIIKDFIKDAENIYNEIGKSGSKNYSDVVVAAYDGFLRSFGFFVYKSINEIFSTYINIENSMKTRVPYSQKDNCESNDYKMF